MPDDLGLEFQIKKIQLEPGDILVFGLDGYISEAAQEHLCESLKKALGDRYKQTPVLLLEKGLKVGVIHYL